MSLIQVSVSTWIHCRGNKHCFDGHSYCRILKKFYSVNSAVKKIKELITKFFKNCEILIRMIKNKITQKFVVENFVYLYMIVELILGGGLFLVCFCEDNELLM